MPKSYLTLAVCFVSLVAALVSMLIIRRKIKQISELPGEVISKQDKEKHMETLTQRLYIILGTLGVSAVNILLPDGLLKFTIPLIAMVVLGAIMSTTMDELSVFDIKKDDVDTFLEERERRKREMKKQREMMEEANRKRKEQKNKEE